VQWEVDHEKVCGHYRRWRSDLPTRAGLLSNVSAGAIDCPGVDRCRNSDRRADYLDPGHDLRESDRQNGRRFAARFHDIPSDRAWPFPWLVGQSGLKQLQPDFTKDIDPKQVKDLQTSDGVLKASILLRLDHKLRQFRNSGIAEVEIRACNLGANRGALAALGDILDILAISAPKVGMFYARVNPAPRNNFFRSVRTLRQWTKRPPGTGASLFLDGPGDAPVVPNSRRRPGPVRHGETGRGAGVESGGGLALRVSILGENHDHIITDSAAAPDWGAVSRFVARNIMSPSRYSGNGPFFIAGMETRDSQGRPFTLPLDPNYKASLVTYLPPFKSFRG
jgi:hypothetical protein